MHVHCIICGLMKIMSKILKYGIKSLFVSLKASSRPSDHSDWANDKNAIGERLLPRVAAINSNWSRKITGMLLSECSNLNGVICETHL